MKRVPDPDEIRMNQAQEDFDAMACSAEFSQGCIEPQEQK
jgi:hypothetical protein